MKPDKRQGANLGDLCELCELCGKKLLTAKVAKDRKQR
jgi:hypothetical protein